MPARVAVEVVATCPVPYVTPSSTSGTSACRCGTSGSSRTSARPAAGAARVHYNVGNGNSVSIRVTPSHSAGARASPPATAPATCGVPARANPRRANLPVQAAVQRPTWSTSRNFTGTVGQTLDIYPVNGNRKLTPWRQGQIPVNVATPSVGGGCDGQVGKVSRGPWIDREAGARVHSGPRSARHAGRHSTLVTCRSVTSASTRTWSRTACRTRETSSRT